MTIFEILSIGIGLAMDAFAVSICKGLAIRKVSVKKCFIISSYFGIFQALMPILGYMASIKLENRINKYSHYISFVLLVIIGLNMIKEAKNEKDEDNINDVTDVKTMVTLAIATSVDAFAVGVTMAFLEVSIIKSSVIIGVITFALSWLGVTIGNIFGRKYEKKAQILGGIILILIGIKIII